MPAFDFTVSILLAQEGGGGPFGQLTFIVPLVIIGLLFYMMIVQPERRQREKLRLQQSSLKKNDKVIIAGGIYAVVVDAPKEGDRIKVRVDENNNTTLRVLRNSVLQVLDDDEKKEGSKPEKAAPDSTSGGK